MRPVGTGKDANPLTAANFDRHSVSDASTSGGPFDDSDEPTSEAEARLAVIVSELTDLMQRGQPIDIHTVCKLHPEHASDLMFLWGTVLVTDAVGGAEAKLIEESAAKSDSGSGK